MQTQSRIERSRWSTQKGNEMQRFGHLVKLRIALAENVRKEGVDDLNQLLADVMTCAICTRSTIGR
jgi:hypothetical protein